MKGRLGDRRQETGDRRQVGRFADEESGNPKLVLSYVEGSSIQNDLRRRLLSLYADLHAHFGHEPHWWPIFSESPQFEMIVGAVLVQRTRWETAEAAVLHLHHLGLLSPGAIASADTDQMAELIRPCAFYNQKAPGLQAIGRHLVEHHNGDVAALLRQERQTLRAELLSLPRIGRETADTIMLYAGGHPVFVVDTYARRLFARLDLAPGVDFARAPYDTVQHFVEAALAPSHPPIPDHGGALRHLLWDLHALIDEACIHHCTAARPRCDQPGTRRSFADPRKCAEHCTGCGGCPLRATCVYYRGAA